MARFAIIKDVLKQFLIYKKSTGGPVNEEEFREFIEFPNDFAGGDVVDSSDSAGENELLYAYDKISKSAPAKRMIINQAVE